jgi:hypothetical protein
MSKNKLKILHLMGDEKFTGFVIKNSLYQNQINDIKLEHCFLYNNSFLRYAKSDNNNIIIKSSYKEYCDFLSKTNYDVIIVHSLTLIKSQAIASLKKRNICIVWLMWGVDFYGTDFYKKSLYFSKTETYYNKHSNNNVLQFFKNILRPIYHQIIYNNTFNKSFIKTVSKVDLFAPIIPSELNLVKELPFFKAKTTKYSYAILEDSLGDLFEKTFELGDGVFIGNSNTLESNHLDALYLLKKLNVKNRKIIIPLSYGGTEKYKNTIVKKGKYFFGENFEPLTSFVSKIEYNNKLLSCNVAIYYHKRQQALGNVIISLYMGHKVFLSEKNLLYKHFVEKGFFVFSIEKEFSVKNINGNLELEKKAINRSLLNKEYSNENIQKIFSNFYVSILSTIKRKQLNEIA